MTTPGGGATFVIDLPLAGGRGMSRVKRRVLVVDDEPAVLRAIGVALESQGYDVQAATTGEQAVARAAAAAPDLILLDLGLPGIDGLEVIRRVRAFLDSTPIIVLSAWGEDETKVRALDLGRRRLRREAVRAARAAGARAGRAAARASARRPARASRRAG